ncbi:MAG: hypothetical protein CL878_11810 [Dehalococcoidia bacterium]|nr:hypothetical protein [Dehalococcoidia bacterium]
MTKPAFAATLHDPDGRMVEPARAVGASLWKRYSSAHIVATPQTASELITLLSEAGAEISTGADSRIGAGRRQVLSDAVQAGASAVHYCDFDRLIHWLRVAPPELQAVLDQLTAARTFEFLILGRTAAAFGTHPRVQRETETVTNHAFSAWFGHPADVGAGSCGVTAEGAALIAEHSDEPTNATDAEWPAIVQCLAPGRVRYRATEGLSFETADYFMAEIRRAGGEVQWQEQVYEQPAMWLQRLELSHNSVRAMLAVAKRLGSASPPTPSPRVREGEPAVGERG